MDLAADFPDGAQDRDRIRAESVGDFKKFKDIDPALAALVFGDEGLRPLQTPSDGVLGQAGLVSRRNKDVAQGPMFGRMQGFRETARLFGHKAAENDPGFGLSQNWMLARKHAIRARTEGDHAR